MSGLLEAIRAFMDQLVLGVGYFGLVLVMIIENLIPPIPSEFVLPFAGFLVQDGRMNLALVLLFTTFGAFVGTTAFYWLGRALGEERVRLFIRRFGRYVLIREADYDEALSFFRRYDGSVIFWARFVPAVRSLISLPAGVANMRFGRFALFTVAGTLIWNLVLVLAGVLLGSQWERVLGVVDRLESVLWVLLIAAIVTWFVWQRSRQRRSRQTGGPSS